jgi:hypothetical protein
MHRRTFLASLTALSLALRRTFAHAGQVLGTGTFRDGDPGHTASGSVEIVKSVSGAVRVTISDLKVTPGPDLYVYLVAEPDPLFPEDVEAKHVLLGRLEDLDADQVYDVPDGIDLSEWGCVAIWCDEFTTIFGVATITHTT